MAFEGLESAVSGWLMAELGSAPSMVEPLRAQMSDVFLITLGDGEQLVLKIRDDPTGRAVGCLGAQHRVWESGLACPRPVSEVRRFNARSAHLESYLPGGRPLGPDDVDAASRSARLLADVMGALAGLTPTHPPLPNPDWVRWDYAGPGEWPPHAWIDSRPNQAPLPSFIESAAGRVRERMRRAMQQLHNVLGHADWEAQNLRWDDAGPIAIHDWDSVAFQSEAAIVGAACGAFASNETPMLAPIAESESFLSAYQDHREKAFSPGELQVAWAASLWPAIHNARAEFRCELESVAGAQLDAQAEDRLSRAGC